MANGIVLNIDTTKSEFQNPMVQLRQGDGNYQSLDVTVTSNGEPLDLTGWTVTFMGTTAGGFKIVDSAVTVTNALQGEFTYTPTKSWGQDQGEFKNAYFKFTKADETASGASFRVNVLDAVDLTAEEAGDYISVVDVMIDKIKTDMDNKLAKTQKTLSDTQSQAITVKGNVNDLNNNVNDLKSQNNAIKTSDNTWSGTNTFNKKIIAPAGVQGNADTAGKAASADMLNTRTATFNDFADVAKNMVTYSGNWQILGVSPINNGPYGTTSSDAYVTINSAGWDDAGLITLTGILWDSRIYYIGIVAAGHIAWTKLSDDSTVLHLTGTETITGDKTLTGNITFTQPINGFFGQRTQPITDLNLLNNKTYNGIWGLDGRSVLNSPEPNTGFLINSVLNSGSTIQRLTITTGQNKSRTYERFYSGTWSNWSLVPVDGQVVHNTGDESISGDKTFLSGNYGLRVTSSGVQKTSDGGATWTNI